jgi:hypothetical protein
MKGLRDALRIDQNKLSAKLQKLEETEIVSAIAFLRIANQIVRANVRLVQKFEGSCRNRRDFGAARSRPLSLAFKLLWLGSLSHWRLYC